MTTFSELVDETLLKMAGFGVRQDNLTHLVNAVTSSQDTLVLHSADSLGKGVIEIDDELIWVDTFDRTNGNVTVPPYGRGYFGTTAASHAAGAKVTVAPTYTRAAVKTAINDTIRSVYPKLFGVASLEFTANAAQTTYALPTRAEEVLSVRYQEIGPSQRWVPVTRYSVDGVASVDSFGSSVTIDIGQYIPSGRSVRVVYSKRPTVLTSNWDDFSATTGLPESVKDVIVLGAQWRLLASIEPSRLNFSSASADVQSDRIQYGSGSNVARFVYTLFQERLNEEIDSLRSTLPSRLFYTN